MNFRKTARFAVITALAIGALSTAFAAEGQTKPRLSRAIDALYEKTEAYGSMFQNTCDQLRVELKRDFLQTIFSPVQDESNRILSRMAQEESRRLNVYLKNILSPDLHTRTRASQEANAILKDVASRSISHPGFRAEVLPGSPFSSLRVEGPPTAWQAKKFRATLRYEGSPGEKAYHYGIKLQLLPDSPSGISKETTLEEVVEAQIPYKCRMYLTGLNKEALYAVQVREPAFRSWAEMTDPNTALAALNGNISNQHRPSPQVFGEDLKTIPTETSAATAQESTSMDAPSAAPGI